MHDITYTTTCDNCHRRGNELGFVNRLRDAVTKKKRMMYYFVDGTSATREVALCGECDEYLLGAHKTPKFVHYWPAMVYCFITLTYDDLALSVDTSYRFRLLPATWRNWWIHVLEQTDAMEEDSLIHDVTTQREGVQRCLRDLKWLDLSRSMDRHFAFPEIRCPWGCSEFLHQVNDLPFHDFLWLASNYTMPIYRKTQGKSWVDGINPSYPSSCQILEKFWCKPSLSMTDNGPMLLACRHHTASSSEAYVHVPESPTGTIYTPNADQLAPEVIRPRVLRAMKTNAFSDTYKTALMQGGYSGFDSSYITTKGVYAKTDNLSLLRDSLAISGRDDIRCHVRSLSTDDSAHNYVPQNTIDSKLHHAQKDFPNPRDLPQAETATCIPIDAAVMLQENVYEDTTHTISAHRVTADGGVKITQELIQPPWPRFFVLVHRLDGFGQRFRRVDSRDFSIWVLLGITTTVPEVWQSLGKSVKDNVAWPGHWLAYATSKLGFVHPTASKSSKTLFPKKNVTAMLNMFHPPLSDQLFSEGGLRSLFSNCDDLQVLFGKPCDLPDRLDSATNVLLLLLPLSTDTDDWVTSTSDSVLPGPLGLRFELRALIVGYSDSPASWKLFARHSSGHKYWIQNTQKCHFSKAADTPGMNQPSFAAARIAIYCRKREKATATLRRRYMTCLGGQNTVYCDRHQLPFILNHLKGEKTYSCVCDKRQQLDGKQANYSWTATGFTKCLDACSYVCPSYKFCGASLCTYHHTQTITACKRSPETVLYLSNRGARYGRSPQSSPSDGGAIRPAGVSLYSNNPDAATGLAGPTSAFELAQDLLSDDDADDDAADEEETEDHEEELHEGGEEEERQHEKQQQEAAGSIPLTNSGVDSVLVSVELGDNLYSTPLYVLMNQQGHLLTRQSCKLRMTRRHCAFYQKIVAQSKSQTIPLVYAEAMLFSSMFWISLPDGTIPGALPTALWSDVQTLKKIGVASMRDHIRTRLNNPALLCSTDTRYHFFEFDALLNLGLRGKDTRVVLQRGFADSQGQDGVRFRESSDSAELYGETSENQANVHKLAALAGDRRPHYFFTQSCNQSTCRGLKILRDWVQSYEAVRLVSQKYKLDHYEAARYLRESAAPYVLRSWNEVIDVWMRYIIESDEAPLHKIEYAWYRKEFQDKQGNPSHIHAILRTVVDISTKQGLNAVLSKIRGSLADLVHHHELAGLQQKGCYSSYQELQQILQHAQSFLTHRCHERCQVPKIDEKGQTYYVCKAPDNFFRTDRPQAHTIQVMPVHHSKEATELLGTIGMPQASPFAANDGQPAVDLVDSLLRIERHVPKCSIYCPKFSPTNPDLFFCYPSSQNLQLCTGFGMCAYLVKYISGLDDVALINIKAQSKNSVGFATGKLESLKNTKITGNKIRAYEKKASIGTEGRALTQMEALTCIQGSPLVTTTEQFIHVPTSPREYRPAVFTMHVSSGMRPPDASAILAVTGQTARKKFFSGYPPYRFFTEDQIIVIKDELQSPLSTDAVTIFSMRPPELRFVSNIRLYLRWFIRIHVAPVFDVEKSMAYLAKTLNVDLHKCPWLDGLNAKLVLRRGAIADFLDYAEACDVAAFGNSSANKRNMVQLLKLIKRLHGTFDLGISVTRSNTQMSSAGQYKFLSETFLSPSTTLKLPTVWWTPVYPKFRSRFVVQLLLLFGQFETEYSLMKAGNMKQAFIEAGLFNVEAPSGSIRTLMTKYVRQCLSVQPCSTFQFDRNLCLAHSIICDLLLPSDTVSPVLVIGTPSALQSSMVDETTIEVAEFEKGVIATFAKTLSDDLRNCGLGQCLPRDTDLLTVVGLSGAIDVEAAYVLRQANFFPPPRLPSSHQNLESYNEQCDVMKAAKRTIDNYRSFKQHQNLVICGGPGNGKTTVCQLIALYALTKGLTGVVTTVVANRAKQLGGIHIHQLCSLTAFDGKRSPGQRAEAAIASLYRKPKLLHLWQKMDFLYIDELGMLSSEMLATVDIIARHCKKSGHFMGGILCIATLDILQLLPFQGTPLLLSLNMMTDFTFRELKHSVRAANDAELRKICELSRTVLWTPQLEAHFRALITNNCNFVTGFDDPAIPDDAIFVFGRKAPCKKAEATLLQKLKASDQTPLFISTAVDEESTTAGNWNKASLPVELSLSRNVKQVKELPLFVKGRYEFTYNEQGRFQQGQLAMLLQIDEEAVHAGKPIPVFRAPPGAKSFPPLVQCTETFLQSLGWESVRVPFSTSPTKRVLGRIMGRRSQYGLRLRVASTIHASMGSTLPKLVTAVTNFATDPDLDFTLWEAAQVVVLLSRTRYCADMFFIGQPGLVAEALLLALKITNRFVPQIRVLLQNLCCEHTATTILQVPCMFRPCDIVLPSVDAVYLLVSTVDTNYMYIGETRDIRKRLNQHNCGQGSAFTNNRLLQPWAVFGFVHRFLNRAQRRSFESRWRHSSRSITNRARAGTPEGMLSLGYEIAANLNEGCHYKLRIQRCGTIDVQLDDPARRP